MKWVWNSLSCKGSRPLVKVFGAAGGVLQVPAPSECARSWKLHKKGRVDLSAHIGEGPAVFLSDPTGQS